MRLSNIRERWGSDNRKMKRARRLYVFLVRHELLKNSNSIVYFIHRMQYGGLYSKKTYSRDIAFSIWSHMYAIHRRQFNEKRGLWGWSNYTKDRLEGGTDWIHQNVKGIYNENKKPRVRMQA